MIVQNTVLYFYNTRHFAARLGRLNRLYSAFSSQLERAEHCIGGLVSGFDWVLYYVIEYRWFSLVYYLSQVSIVLCMQVVYRRFSLHPASRGRRHDRYLCLQNYLLLEQQQQQ
jgi:hypothetical protein